jgi:hypothetical protein
VCILLTVHAVKRQLPAVEWLLPRHSSTRHTDSCLKWLTGVPGNCMALLLLLLLQHRRTHSELTFDITQAPASQASCKHAHLICHPAALLLHCWIVPSSAYESLH